MLRKAISFGRMPWEFYLKDVEIAKFENNTHEKCAIVAVSGRSTKRLLFVQSNNSDKSYDLVDRTWIAHPWEKCNSKQEDILKEYCDAKTDKETQCPQSYINFNPFSTMGKPCTSSPRDVAAGFDAHGRTICKKPWHMSIREKNMYKRARWRHI